MLLAWRNLLEDKARLVITVIGIAFATFLMTFQGSLLAGFLKAASMLIDAADGEIWIGARGVSCLEFPGVIDTAWRERVLSMDEVVDVRRLITGFTAWRKSDGAQQTVLVVGVEPPMGARFPVLAGRREEVLIDESNRALLGIERTPVGAEIAGRRVVLAGITDGFGSFMGSPHVFAGYHDAERYLRWAPWQTMFLIAKLRPGADVEQCCQRLRARLPHVSVWTKRDFSRRARLYWTTQTGAGAALLTAAFLGFLVGTVVVSQTIYASTMERLDEFATLKALGASNAYVIRGVLVQALASGAIGSLAGLALTYPAAAAIRGTIAWIYTPPWLPPVVFAASLLMCAMASILSIRTALQVDPAKVFRA